jgi:hypothetical protein
MVTYVRVFLTVITTLGVSHRVGSFIPNCAKTVPVFKCQWYLYGKLQDDVKFTKLSEVYCIKHLTKYLSFNTSIEID